jgi:Galactose oxidase-like, Early set domain
MAWEVLKEPNSNNDLLSGNIAIHAALVETPDGPAIFYFDGVFGAEGARLLHVADRTVTPPPDQDGMLTPGFHIMCSGHALLGDGRLLIGGGVVDQNIEHAGPKHDSGERRCYIYHPLSNKFEQVKDLNFQPGSEDNPRGGGRWYPTLLTLASGEVFAVSGHPYIGDIVNGVPDSTGADDYIFPGDMARRHNNNTPERYSPGINQWTLLTAESSSFNNQGIDEYARVHLGPSGRVFFSTRAKSNKRFYSAYSGTYSGPDVPAGDAAYHNGSETTSVLLPILMSDLNNVWVLACGATSPQRINIATESTQWVSAGTREAWSDPGTDGDPVSPVRNHANSVILPTGEIFVCGGVGPATESLPQGTSVRRPEIYTPPINWGAGKYINEDGTWATLPEAATVIRGYHGVALLMPDGAVFTAGSTDSAGGDTISDGVDENGNPTYAAQNEYRIEIFKPWYFDAPHDNNRPTISSSSVPKSIGYAYTFRFNTPQANSIERVVVTRCGSTTHALDTDQRLVSLDFTKINSTTIELTIPYMPEHLPPGRYMLWVVDAQDRPSKWAPLIRIAKQKPLFSVDFDKFAKSELDALGSPATFTEAVFLVYDGFLPGEVSNPSRTVVWKDSGNPVSGVTTTLGATKYEGGFDNKDIAQRIVFPVNVVVNNDSAFDAVPEDPGFRDILLKATMGPYKTEVTLTLTRKLNPRMRHGDPHWLAIDLRAFSTRAGAPPFTAGLTNPSDLNGAYQYIQDLLKDYNKWNKNQAHPFDSLPTVQETSHLPLYPDVDGDAVFNFAVARVRFRAPHDVKANDVRVFFRLWTTGWTAMEYSTDKQFGSYPRDNNGAAATPRLGLYGGEVNTIPCFAEPRKPKMTDQEDAANIQQLKGIGQEELHTYYGCLIDSNQDAALFPLKPDPDDPGPYSGDLNTIRQIMRGLHHCLVAEIHYWPDDEIPSFATPASSDNLAQRNLLFDEAPNPGEFATHLVHFTYELKASPVPLLATPMERAPAISAARLHPDELVIDFGNLPRDSHLVLYMPQVDVDEVLRFAAQHQGPPNLSKAGDHAIRCKVSDVGFIPIPKVATTTIAGLATVQLPPNIVQGQKFTIVLRQVDGRKLRTIGTTQFDIRIKTRKKILPKLTRDLAILKHIALSIPPDNRWYPVFQRYLGELGDRVRGLGGNPDTVTPYSGVTGKPGGRPGPGDRSYGDGHSGKICDLIYDCFGDFEGFVLETCDGRMAFKACEPSVEEVVRRACKERTKVTIFSDGARENRFLRIVLHCC